MARLPDWRRRFAEAVIERRATPMRWGWSDCALTAADLALAVCGVDHAAPFRGRYASRYGATRRLVELGCRSLVEYLDARLPRAERPREGDFVLAPSPPLDDVMVAAGFGMAWGQGESGLVRVPIPPGALFWSLG